MKDRWFASEQVFATFHGGTKRDREQILEIFARIAAFPANFAEFYVKGSDGRDYAVAACGSWIITYWVDTDQGIVRFTELEAAA